MSDKTPEVNSVHYFETTLWAQGPPMLVGDKPLAISLDWQSILEWDLNEEKDSILGINGSASAYLFSFWLNRQPGYALFKNDNPGESNSNCDQTSTEKCGGIELEGLAVSNANVFFKQAFDMNTGSGSVKIEGGIIDENGGNMPLFARGYGAGLNPLSQFRFPYLKLTGAGGRVNLTLPMWENAALFISGAYYFDTADSQANIGESDAEFYLPGHESNAFENSYHLSASVEFGRDGNSGTVYIQHGGIKAGEMESAFSIGSGYRFDSRYDDNDKAGVELSFAAQYGTGEEILTLSDQSLIFKGAFTAFPFSSFPILGLNVGSGYEMASNPGFWRGGMGEDYSWDDKLSTMDLFAGPSLNNMEAGFSAFFGVVYTWMERQISDPPSEKSEGLSWGFNFKGKF